MVAVLMALSGTACAAELTNPEIIHSGEIFTISNGDNLRLGYNENFTGESLSIEARDSLIIESGGRLIIDGGTVMNFGNISNNGIINNNEGYIYLQSGYLENNGTIITVGT